LKEDIIPTELEYKYAISLDIAKKYDNEQLSLMSVNVQYIKQGYLAFSKGMTLRVRHSICLKNKQWYLTYKQKISNRVVEIEKKIDDRDGKDLWSACVGRLTKNRYVVNYHKHTWEIDFFYRDNHLYFVQAEVELKEGSNKPQEIPKFLREFLLYEVPLTDDRFSNKRLSDVEFASRLYKSLVEKKNGYKKL